MHRLAIFVAVAACGNPGPPRPLDPAWEVQQPHATPVKRTPPGPPLAKPRAQTDTYHGVAVQDPYRWLEASTAEVTQWSDAQNAYARAKLGALPELPALRAEIAAIVKAPLTYYGGFYPTATKLFALRTQPTKEQAELVVLADPADAASAKLILDPTIGANAHRSIDWFEPSPDGTRIAISISENGSEKGDLHVIDLDGKELEPAIPNVQRGTGGGDVAWTPDGKGFYYTRYPAAGEKPDGERDFWMQLWFHTLGTPIASDRYELGKDFPKIAEVIAETDGRGRVLCKVQNGDGDTFRHYLRDTKGTWRQLTDWDDGVKYAGFGPTDDLWLISRKNAPRGKVLRLAANAPLAKARVVVPEGDDSIVTAFYQTDQGIVNAGDTFYLNYQVGGPSEVRAFTRTGKRAKSPPLPPVSSTSRPVVWKAGILVSASSYTTARTVYRFTPKTGKLVKVEALSPRPPVDLSRFEVRRELATSKDGTKIPFDIVWPRSARRDGSTPCLVTGYGGYNLSQQPYFLAGWAPLLRRGFCYVSVNLRGGGEFGEAWHQAGMLTRKQNVFDDFAAVLAYLVDRHYTQRDKLGIIGGSNGGLLMGALVTQHPELVKAVVSEVGIYDSVRAETSSNGAYNIPEFGSVTDPAQFKALFAYSPYHHVAAARYPAVLMLTGANDARVEPWHSRKMIAALQAAQTGDAPILLRTSANAGHGDGTDVTEAIEQASIISAFFFWQLH
ncbi:MAG: alpha/beta fold hydrolase [Kofleriaceae bacterium]